MLHAFLFQGTRGDKTVTWEAANTTYEDIINKVYHNFTLEAILARDNITGKTDQSFIYPIGICQNFAYSREVELTLIYDTLPQDFWNIQFDIFITDPRKSTFFSLDFYSQKGLKIGFQNAKLYYDIETVVRDLDNPADRDECDPYQDSSFSECVEHQIQLDISKVRFEM